MSASFVLDYFAAVGGKIGREHDLGLGSVARHADHRNPRDGRGADVIVGLRLKVRLEEEPGFTADPVGFGFGGAVGLLLAVLHGVEAAIWAAAYLWLGVLDSPTDAILYSVDSMTTRGASGLVLQEHWRMMGALEAADGMLLFGISTAYIFAVMQVYWPMLAKLAMTRRHTR
jgi:hypothetical protein